MKRLVLMMTLLVNTWFVQGQSNNGWRFIEQGVSYDQHYLSAFASEEDALDTLNLIVEKVNCLYEPYFVHFLLRLNVKLNVHTRDRREMRIYTSNYWNYRADGCTTPDMVHHLTGNNGIDGVLGESGGGDNALCGIGPHTNSAVCSASELSLDIIKAAVAMAHEIGHHLGMEHENLMTSFMYPSPLLQQCSPQIGLGNGNISQLNALLNSLMDPEKGGCVSVNNFGPNEFCESCDTYIKITNMADRSYDFDFGCFPNNQDTIDLSTAVTNICDRNKKYSISITYNDNDVEIIEMGDIFKDPVPYSGGAKNRLINSDTIFLRKGGADFAPFKIRVKGNGRYPNGPTGRTGAAVDIVYYFDHPAGIEDTHFNRRFYATTSLAVHYDFNYPYQIDMRGIPLVKASELLLPFEPLNFCLGDFVKDVYIDGDFVVDIDQKYCNTNFYFGPNSRMIIQPKKKLILDNSTLTACDDRWQGIYLNPRAVLETENNTTIENAVTGIDGLSAKVTLNKTIFKNNLNGIWLRDSRIETSKDISISEGNYGIRLDRCAETKLHRLKINRMKIRGIKAEYTSLSLSGINISGTSKSGSGWGIESIGDVHPLTISGEFGVDTISNWQVGINCLKNGMILKYITFKDNFIGITHSNSRGLWHDLYHNKFINCSRGINIINSTPGSRSKIVENEFENVDYGITISNALNPGTGWDILGSNFTESGMAGIRLNNSSGNVIRDCYMESKGLAKSNLISINGGMKNSACHNQLFNGAGMISEANQVKGIAMNGVAGYNVTCNEVQGGSYGFNFWAMGTGDFMYNASNQVHTGLYCGLYPADGNVVMGKQEHKYNIWNNSAHTVGAKHLSNDKSFLNYSQFTVIDNPNFGQYWPNPIIPGNLDWFVKEYKNITPRDCSNYNELWRTAGGAVTNTSHTTIEAQPVQLTIAYNPGEEAASPANSVSSSGDACGNAYVMPEELVIKIIDQSIPFDRYELEIHAHSYWQLYKLVQSNSSAYVNYPGVAQFISGHAPTLGVLYQAERTLAGVNHYSVSGTYFNNNINQPTQTHSTVTDSIYRAMYAEERAIHITDIQNALFGLQSLSLEAAPWTNTKDLLTISGKAFMNDTLTALDMYRLEEIAHQCPLYGGDAVYGARGMLEAYNVYQDYDDNVLCGTTEWHSAKPKASGVYLNPNPAYDRLTITAEQMTSVQIMDINGRIIRDIEIGGNNEADIDIRELSPGIYLVKVTYGSEHSAETKKLIKIQ
ncbi:MAG: T9SS type A sorting domain-containing protein [Chitinophagales bacterium]|nr:T9SS type A sorting domain-containing protein [Chitinophagales bacterium]